MTETLAAADPVHDFIAKTVAEYPVVLFMKGVPDQPRCGFSSVVVQILDHIGVEFVGVDVLQDEACATASRPIPTGRPSRSSM